MGTVSNSDKTLKVFDVLNFDLSQMLKLDYSPYACEFINNVHFHKYQIAVYFNIFINILLDKY